MKKLFVLLLSFALMISAILALTSCGDEESEATEHTHVSSDWIIEKDATCKEDGVKYKKCTVCGKTLESGTVEKLSEHTASDWIIDVEASCLTEGRSYIECTVCGEVLDEQIFEKLTTHTAGEWILDKASTCTVQGEHHKNCTVCGAFIEFEKLPLADHDYVDFSCTMCNKSYYAEGLAFSKVSGGYAVSGIGDCSESEIRIPPKYKELSVVGIADNAFSGAKKVEIIILPDTVVSIGASAFKDCAALCEINIPEGVTKIGAEAFKNCKALKSAKLPDGITSIPNMVFNGCSALISVEVSPSVKSFGEYVFSGCKSLKSFDIPDGITTVSVGMFYGCQSLEAIVIPEGVTLIGTSAFSGCTSLETVKIPDKVTELSGGAFSGCSNLVSVEFGEGSGLLKIGRVAFSNCSRLVSFTVPSKVTTIEAGAFRSCSNLSSFTLGKSVTSIANGTTSVDVTFENCVKLVDIYNLSNLKLTIGSTVYGSIAKYALNIYTPTSGESKLHTTEDGFIYYLDGESCYLIDYIGERDVVIIPKSFEGKYFKIYNRAFAYSDIKRLIIPDTILGVQNLAFINSPSMTIYFESASYPSGGMEKNWNYNNNPVVNGWSWGEHLPTDWVVKTEATCSAEGTKEIKCRECGEILASEVIAKTSHTSSDWQVISEATCSAEGVSVKTCTVCGEELERTTTPPIPHTSSDWIVINEATCVSTGESYKECTVCKKMIDHDILPMLPHTEPDDWTVVLPTCKAEGSKTKSCTECGEVLKSETIAKLSHKESEWHVGTAPTCKAGGTEVISCTECGEIIKSKNLPITHHKFVGDNCSVCGRGYSEGLVFKQMNKDKYYFAGLGTCEDTDVVIPPKYNGLPVTYIEGGFENGDNVVSIQIPDTVTGIYWYSFINLKNLERVYIPDSVTEIGNCALQGCDKLTIYCEAPTVPDGWSPDWNIDRRPVVWGYKMSD